MSDVSIRPAEPDDAETIVDFQLRMARESEGLELDPAIVQAGVRAVLADPHKGVYWLADLAGQTAACLMIIPEWSDWRNGTVWWIHSLYVCPESRRRGVLRTMYEHLRAMVQADASLRGLRLYVEKDNAVAQAAYGAFGMDGEHYRMYEWLK